MATGNGGNAALRRRSREHPAVQSETTVSPGGVATFVFQVRAPVLPGTYVIHLRPVIDGTTWMEDQGVFFAVVVR